jgi:hypothetical protein
VIPIHDLKRAVLDLSSAAFLRTHFGEDWFRHGDPRTVLPLSLEELLAFARSHGIPRSVLTEDCWTGDDHFVMDKQNGRWRIGFAERGEVRLIGTADSEQAARDLVTQELFALYESAADPSHWRGGVPAGTPWGRFSLEGNA